MGPPPAPWPPATPPPRHGRHQPPEARRDTAKVSYQCDSLLRKFLSAETPKALPYKGFGDAEVFIIIIIMIMMMSLARAQEAPGSPPAPAPGHGPPEAPPPSSNFPEISSTRAATMPPHPRRSKAFEVELMMAQLAQPTRAPGPPARAWGSSNSLPLAHAAMGPPPPEPLLRLGYRRHRGHRMP